MLINRNVLVTGLGVLASYLVLGFYLLACLAATGTNVVLVSGGCRGHGFFWFPSALLALMSYIYIAAYSGSLTDAFLVAFNVFEALWAWSIVLKLRVFGLSFEIISVVTTAIISVAISVAVCIEGKNTLMLPCAAVFVFHRVFFDAYLYLQPELDRKAPKETTPLNTEYAA